MSDMSKCHKEGHVDQIEELQYRVDDLQKKYDFLKRVLEDIRDEDFRGNRSSASVKAFSALRKLYGDAS